MYADDMILKLLSHFGHCCFVPCLHMCKFQPSRWRYVIHKKKPVVSLFYVHLSSECLSAAVEHIHMDNGVLFFPMFLILEMHIKHRPFSWSQHLPCFGLNARDRSNTAATNCLDWAEFIRVWTMVASIARVHLKRCCRAQHICVHTHQMYRGQLSSTVVELRPRPLV